MMRDYAVFGGCLRSELEFSELRPSRQSSPSWTLRASPERIPLDGAEALGSDHVEHDCHVRLYRHANGYRLEYDDTGSFDISADGAEIVWCAPSNASLDAARLDILGRVLATALHAAGVLTLHGSAAVIGGRAVAFLAPKHHGKSTLALALAAAGAPLLTDDTLPVEPGAPPMARPGVHAVRLWSDSARVLRRPDLVIATKDDAPVDAAAAKAGVATLPETLVVNRPVPLAAVYLLTPVASAERAARRTRYTAVLGALALIRHAKIGPLLGRADATVLLQRATVIADAIPVYDLQIVRDFDRLDEVVAQLFAWHAEEDRGRGAAEAG